MEQQSDGAAKALAFANGLRKNISVAGRRWSHWPGGPNDLAFVLRCIDHIQSDLQGSADAPDHAALITECVADLRAILEWTTYQSGSIATARALLVARKTRAFAEQLGLVSQRVSGLAMLEDSEESLIENVRTKNGYMNAIAERHAHLELPRPLVNADALLPQLPKPPNKLNLIQQLRESAKKQPPKR